MPIYEAPGADVQMPNAAKAEKPPAVYVCTISDGDQGEPCRRCGYAEGPGHGKVRG